MGKWFKGCAARIGDSEEGMRCSYIRERRWIRKSKRGTGHFASPAPRFDLLAHAPALASVCHSMRLDRIRGHAGLFMNKINGVWIAKTCNIMTARTP